MKTLFKALLTLSLMSCGTQNGSDSAQPSATAAPKSSTPIATSYYVATAKELRDCDASTKGFLAYVKELEQFQACLESGWTTVDIKGKDGKDGKDGSTGSTGTSGTMVSGNQWYDPITTKMWVMTTISTSTVGWSNSVSACGGAYRMPIASEIALALTHGMKATAQALVNAPTQIIADGGQTYNVSNGALNNTGSGAQFCIAQ